MLSSQLFACWKVLVMCKLDETWLGRLLRYITVGAVLEGTE